MTMMASVMTDDEMLSLGYSPIVHAGETGIDNPMVDALGSIHQTDREGRQVISYKQYQQLSAQDARLDNFAIRMYRPGYERRGAFLIQASKYLKWYGAGYRPVEEARQERPAPRPQPEDEPIAFYCRDKYPDCKRFFDNEKGLKFHWRRDHGEEGFKGRLNKEPEE